MAIGIDVRPNERAPVILAIAGLAASTAAHTLLETARDALFLEKLPATTLPWMYLAIAALGVVVTRLLGSRRRARTASVAMGIAALTATVFFGATRAPSPAVLYALFVWTGTFGAIIALELWMLLGAAFDVGQAKRLFGLIGAGAVAGATLGALVAKLVAELLGTRPLLVAATSFFALGIFPTLALERRAPASDKRHEPSRSAGLPRPASTSASSTSTSDDTGPLLRDPYLAKMGGFLLAGTLALTLGDFLFKTTIASAVPRHAIASTLATVHLVYNGLSLLVQLFATGLILRLVGLPRTLLLLPVLVLAAGVGFVVTGGLAAAILLRGADGVFRHSVYKTTTELLSMPLSDARRRAAKPALDLLTQRGGQALAALLALGAVSLGASPRTIAALAALFALAWVTLGATLGGPYVDAFRRKLQSGGLSAEGVPDLDLGALEAILSAFNSSRDAEVTGAIDLLASQGRAKLIPALILYHPSSTVVLRGFEALTAAARSDIVPIARRLLAHPDPEVRAAAVRALVRLDRAGSLEDLVRDPRDEVRASALVSVLATRVDEALDEELRRLCAAGGEAIELALLRAAREEPSARFVAWIEPLAQPACSLLVRTEALRALGAHAARFPEVRPDVLPVLSDAVPNRDLGATAREALAQLGEVGLAHLDGVLTAQANDRTGPAYATALLDYDVEAAVPVMVRQLRESSGGRVRYRCLKNLHRIREERGSVSVDPDVMAELAKDTASKLLGYVELRVVLERGQSDRRIRATPAGSLVLELLRDKVRHARTRLFLLLGLIYQREDFGAVERGLASSDPKLRATSRELCDNVVRGKLHDPLLLILEDVPDDVRIERWPGRSSPTYEGALDRLVELSGGLGSLARFHAAELRGEQASLDLSPPSPGPTPPPAEAP
jgi:AAA family ATP:ADP antiporter